MIAASSLAPCDKAPKFGALTDRTLRRGIASVNDAYERRRTSAYQGIALAEFAGPTG